MMNIYGMEIRESVFDEAAIEDGIESFTKIRRFTLINGSAEVDVIDYGATITAVRVPDRDGNVGDVVLGFNSIKDYMATSNNPYFGATVGRVANRIANGKFTLDEMVYNLSRNEGETTLHGGIVGFNRRLWTANIDKEGLVMTLKSPHLDQGFPGEVNVCARFILTSTNKLVIKYCATTNQTTPFNMTNHSYFNLAGHCRGKEKLYEHYLMINSSNFTPTDSNGIPTGKIQDVFETVLDFSSSKNLGDAIRGTGEADGFDVNYCVQNEENETMLVACLEHPTSGRKLTVYSNQPGVQLYTANCLLVKEGNGKEGVGYTKHSGVCLETQNYPNAINQRHFPSSLLKPNQKYLHCVSYEFSVTEKGESVHSSDEGSATTQITDDYYNEGTRKSMSESAQDNRQSGVKAQPIEDAETEAEYYRQVFPDFSLERPKVECQGYRPSILDLEPPDFKP